MAGHGDEISAGEGPVGGEEVGTAAGPVVVLCPKCGGQGHVAKPPWVPGDVHTWVSAGVTSYPCRVCSGIGVLGWAPPAPEVGAAPG